MKKVIISENGKAYYINLEGIKKSTQNGALSTIFSMSVPASKSFLRDYLPLYFPVQKSCQRIH